MLDEVKHYIRVDEEYDDDLIESYIQSSEEFLLGAGVPTEKKGTALYNLCIKMICKKLYDGVEEILDRSINIFIIQLKY